MPQSVRDLEIRMDVMQKDHAEIVKWIPSIIRLVELLESVESALEVFVKIGNAAKWIATTLLALSGIAWVIKHFGSAP